MLISVDLPAPFSPTMPVIAPFSMRSDTPRTACTVPNDFWMPWSSIATAASITGWTSLARIVAHVIVDDDLARLDVGLGGVDLGLHWRPETLLVVLVERPVDPALLEAEHLRAALPGAGLRRLEAVVGREVDPLQHRGQHRAGMQVVLVGIDADAELAAIFGGLKNADAGRAGGGIDDVDAAIELALGKLGAAARIVPRGGRGTGHVADQLGLRVGVLDALLEAALELPHQRDVHAAHKADLAGLRRQRRQHADQERALLLLENHGLHVGQVDDTVDDGEVDVGKFLGDLLERDGLGEADGDDGILPALGTAPLRLLELRLVGGFEFGDGDSCFLLEFLGAHAHAFIEGFVEFSAGAVDDGGLDGGLRHGRDGQCTGREQGKPGADTAGHDGPLFVGQSVARLAGPGWGGGT